MIDSHLHTNYSHGKSSLDEMILASIEKELENIGFAEHFIYDFFTENGLPTVQGRPVDGTPQLEFSKYCKEVRKAKNLYGKRIKIRLGVEVDYINGKEAEINKALLSQNTEFDFVLGSIHFLGNPLKYFLDYINEPWIKNEYFSILESGINSGLFDIMAHPLLLQYYINIDKKEYKNISENITDLLKNKNVAIEINTDYFTSRDTLNPNIQMLKMCKKKKIPMVIGSDAHSAMKVAKCFPEVIQILKDIGIEKLYYFEKRKPIPYTI